MILKKLPVSCFTHARRMRRDRPIYSFFQTFQLIEGRCSGGQPSGQFGNQPDASAPQSYWWRCATTVDESKKRGPPDSTKAGRPGRIYRKWWRIVWCRFDHDCASFLLLIAAATASGSNRIVLGDNRIDGICPFLAIVSIFSRESRNRVPNSAAVRYSAMSCSPVT